MATDGAIDGRGDPQRRVRLHGGPLRLVAMTVALAVALVGVGMGTAAAVQPDGHDGRLVSSTTPAPWTPNVTDGYVSAFAEVGNTIVAGGTFTRVRPPGSSTTLTRNRLFAFTRNTGAISTTFVPVVNGEVTEVLPTGDGRTVWIAGQFSSLNGQSASRLAKVDVTTGQRVASFAPPAIPHSHSATAARRPPAAASIAPTTIVVRPPPHRAPPIVEDGGRGGLRRVVHL